MKIIRSTKCSLKFTTKEKLQTINIVLVEYGRVCNLFIEKFWLNVPTKKELLKEVINEPETWLSSRLKQCAAREAIDLITASIESAKELEIKPRKPVHKGTRMQISNQVASFEIPKSAFEFDGWLKLTSIGNKIRLDLPIRLHKHFHELNLISGSEFQKSFIITDKYVQFSWKIQTGPKKKPVN